MSRWWGGGGGGRAKLFLTVYEFVLCVCCSQEFDTDQEHYQALRSSLHDTEGTYAGTEDSSFPFWSRHIFPSLLIHRLYFMNQELVFILFTVESCQRIHYIQ